MIKTIKLKNCATYLSEGTSIENCQKINFFYGPNGSGKSTISNFLQDPTDLLYRECIIEWENDTAVDIMVYNRRFRERNFKENIAGVFTLGQATIEDIRALEEMKEQRAKKNEDYTTRGNTLQKKLQEEIAYKATFRDTVWERILKPNEADFQEAFSGFRNNKERFRDEVLRRYQISHSSTETRDALLVREKTLFARKPEKCPIIPFVLDNIVEQIAEIETAAIWSKVIVGNRDLPIGRLIEVLDNADWVSQGRKHLREDGICPFCQKQTITDELKNQLDAFFSGEYEQDVSLIKQFIGQYSSYTDELLSRIKTLRTSLGSYPAAGIEASKIDSIIELLNGYFSKNKAEMLIKEKEPGRIISLTETAATTSSMKQLVINGNAAVTKHNEMVDNYTSEKDTLVADIWVFLMDENEALIAGYLNDIETFTKAKKGIQKGIDVCKQQLDDLDGKIVEAGKNITSVQPTVDEINRSLKSYGFTNFKIVPSPAQPNAYQIQRMDGTLATNTLSEGEETFISFLYFLQFAKGSIDVAKVSNRKVLVLDDPICSLDSTVLYIVSSLVKGLIKDVREGNSDVEQIFILTHNVFFHKETAFIDRRTEVCNDIHFWIISKDNNISTIKAYERNNPIKTSYELLWEELKSNTNASLITTQNIMRRILENYFSILGKTKDDTIVDSFSTIEEKMICRSLLSWINDGSHTIPDDLYIDSYTDSIDRYKQIFKEVFFKMGHEAHYKMMMGES
mgnify:FL=1